MAPDEKRGTGVTAYTKMTMQVQGGLQCIHTYRYLYPAHVILSICPGGQSPRSCIRYQVHLSMVPYSRSWAAWARSSGLLVGNLDLLVGT